MTIVSMDRLLAYNLYDASGAPADPSGSLEPTDAV